MPTAPYNKLSYQPLYDYLRVRYEPSDQRLSGLSAVDVADIIGVHRAQVGRWMQIGSIKFWNADVIACMLGIHPSLIWGQEYWTVMAEMNERAEQRRIHHNTIVARTKHRQKESHEDHNSAVA